MVHLPTGNFYKTIKILTYRPRAKRAIIIL